MIYNELAIVDSDYNQPSLRIAAAIRALGATISTSPAFIADEGIESTTQLSGASAMTFPPTSLIALAPA